MSALESEWTIGLDADDTLWENEQLFVDAEARLRELLAPWVGGDRVDHRLLVNERATLGIYGYGVKGFVLSMLETAIELSAGDITAEALGHILEWGKEILHAPVDLLPGVAETVAVLARTRRLLLITKGDMHHQQRKIHSCGLLSHLIGAEVVDEKDPATYRHILDLYGIDPHRFVMVGNSERSDIEPVVAIGGHGIHVPHHVTWALEVSPNDSGASQDAHGAENTAAGRTHHISRFADLPATVDAIINGAVGP